ncbi:uncharacterized protein K452DRAFT_285122 [Aplosporella prunicola CBS 121167]|uniref:tRNA (guanine(9)-N1)-methyltransferase n=1 Tax=Aplosporella prunicola CBS 121167 TaxID=1176127 RepID=A0A6A6BL06_9PEZI|nr:uncharacterized protein K452DRAFT_285122 [Aplosporella prunicola CBS 121167]KAF2144789.1 hypothetical protein K452DRAFT_285122 [Aplosporella prunicola CBS 121167]
MVDVARPANQGLALARVLGARFADGVVVRDFLPVPPSALLLRALHDIAAMADEQRPSKMQKREHSPQLQEASFAPSEAAGTANAPPNGDQQQQQQPSTAANTSTTTTAEADDDNDVNAQPAAAAAAADASPANPTNMKLDESGKPMSKSAMKKLRRQQEWEAGREERKVQRREKAKAARTRKREEYQAARAANPNEAGANPLPTQRQREKAERTRNQRAKQLPVTFIFDCSFDDLMMDKEMKSLGSQITRCYSDNRNAEFRAHLAISSFGGKLKDRFDGLLNKHYLNWKGFRVFEEDFMDVAEKAKVWMREPRGGEIAGALAVCAKKREAGQDTAMGGTEEKEQQQQSTEQQVEQQAEQPAEQQPAEQQQQQQPAEQEGEVIYLSSEGTETLTELKPYSTYIVGGLVDKNRYKGICHKRATERGVKTAKLPIGEFLQMNSRAVLATNHVNEIMVEWLKCGDWGEAFMKVIPKRKGGQLRSTGEEEEAAEGEEEEEGSAETVEDKGKP